MLQKPTVPNPDDLRASKDRAFGEYANTSGHRCTCYEHSVDGPPQYDPGEVYFCFAKFANPFARQWIGRYAALTILTPTLEALHDAERTMGRPLIPPEWPRVEGVLIQGVKPLKTTARGLAALFERVDLWLRANMIDEIDHRIVDASTPEEWKRRNAELVRLYGPHAWTDVGLGRKDFMKIHATTSTLEMLRRTDYLYMAIPIPYVEVAKDVKDEAVEDEKNKASKAAAAALLALQSIETLVEQQELLE